MLSSGENLTIPFFFSRTEPAGDLTVVEGPRPLVIHGLALSPACSSTLFPFSWHIPFIDIEAGLYASLT